MADEYERGRRAPTLADLASHPYLSEFRVEARARLAELEHSVAKILERLARIEARQDLAKNDKPSWSSDLTMKIIIAAMLAGMALGYAGVDPSRLLQ